MEVVREEQRSERAGDPPSTRTERRSEARRERDNEDAFRFAFNSLPHALFLEPFSMARDNYGGVDSFAQAVAFISASAVSSSSETKLRVSRPRLLSRAAH